MFQGPARLAAVLAGVGLALSACASVPRAQRVPRPNPASAEYLRSWGLNAVNANPAYLAGATGRGVTIALVDCGLEQAVPELRRNVSSRSVDVLAGQRKTGLQERHAAYVAGPLGSALDGQGLVGVAYNATLLSVRADFDGGLNGECAFKPSDLARAIDYALAENAKVVVLPLQAKRPLGPTFEAALARAVSADVAVVIAAGNDAAADPSYPARYAADPRYAGSIVVVGASGSDGALAGWSNKAGRASPYFVSAPGEGVITDCGEKWCRRVSGTSVAAPYVGGALALILEARPDLGGKGAIARLLNGARDEGDPGVDATSGRGRLDIGAAFSAIAPLRRG